MSGWDEGRPVPVIVYVVRLVLVKHVRKDGRTEVVFFRTVDALGHGHPHVCYIQYELESSPSSRIEVWRRQSGRTTHESGLRENRAYSNKPAAAGPACRLSVDIVSSLNPRVFFPARKI